jgi:putative NADH-flavin reductase
MRIFILGASGGVGSSLVQQAIARGHEVTAQTRDPRKLRASSALRVVVGAPADCAFLRLNLSGVDAVIQCIGVDTIGRTTLFSDTTEAVVAAMQATGVKRLVAITGIGAGDTKGHGGWLYNSIIYPLFTRHRYADKDRQEAIIEQTDLDWTVVRPAPFAAPASAEPLQIYTNIPPGLQLSSITRAEVATFILECVESNKYVRQKPFIGHP